MNIPNISGLVKVVKPFVLANRPEILYGTSITATIASVVLAARAGYEARGRVEETQNPSVDLKNPENPITLREKVELTWPCYISPVVGTVTAIGSTTGLHIVHISDKKQMAAATLAAIEEVKISSKQLLNESVPDNSIEKKETIQNSDGVVEDLYLVRDGRSGRDIWSNKLRIEDAINKVNEMINRDGDCGLNLFYSMAGFEELYPEGDDWGWSGSHVEIQWDNGVRDDGRPVKIFRFRKAPDKDYDRGYR